MIGVAQNKYMTCLWLAWHKTKYDKCMIGVTQCMTSVWLSCQNKVLKVWQVYDWRGTKQSMTSVWLAWHKTKYDKRLICVAQNKVWQVYDWRDTKYDTCMIGVAQSMIILWSAWQSVWLIWHKTSYDKCMIGVAQNKVLQVYDWRKTK
jgi:ABC-type glucose/galactose transport system permease subunit